MSNHIPAEAKPCVMPLTSLIYSADASWPSPTALDQSPSPANSSSDSSSITSASIQACLEHATSTHHCLRPERNLGTIWNFDAAWAVTISSSHELSCCPVLPSRADIEHMPATVQGSQNGAIMGPTAGPTMSLADLLNHGLIGESSASR